MIIYEANETDFFSNGLGTLPDATSALVTEERNGEFVLDVIYPQQGLRSELLTKNRIIKADAGHELKDQRFVIKKVTPTMDSDGYIYLTVHAEHVSYITADLGVTPNLTLSGNAAQALEQWQANLVGGHPDITVDSDIISTHETHLDITKATNARQVLGGVEGSILDTWGGEYKFDNLHISLRGQRGTTANTLISYGRNLLTFEQEDDITDTYTSIYPYANVGLADGNNSKLVTVDGYFVDSQYVDRYPNRKLLPVDFGSEFTDYKIGSKPSESDSGIYTTEAEIKKKLTELAKQYIENNRIGIPKVSTKITFADLSKTSEYAPLEQVNLCDIIPIRFEKLGIDTTIKVTRVVWNVLLDEYDSIELGDLRTTLGESISALESKTTGLANAVITAQSTADNQNSIFRTNGGTAEPVAKKVGDLWFKTDGDYQYMYQWDGSVWHEVVNTKTTDDIAKEVDKAKADAEVLSSEVESAKKQAQEAFAKAGFNADEISNVKTATSEVTETLTSTVRQASELSESLKNVASETASRYSTVSSELSDARDSLTAKASELAKEVASNSANITKANSQLYSQSEGLAKVSQSATKMEQTMTDLSGRVHTVETTASETKEALADANGNITTLTKRADGTDTKIADAQGRVQTLESRADTWDLELSKKVDNTTYNAGIQNLGNQINLKANKSDLDGYATKAQLSVESDRITQQASAISSVTTIANGANSKIDNLSFGGRNLLDRTKTLDKMEGNVSGGLRMSPSNINKGFYNGFTTSIVNAGQTSDYAEWGVVVEPEETYTFSFYAKGERVDAFFYGPSNYIGVASSDVSSGGYRYNNDDGHVNFSLTSEYKRYWVTWKLKARTSDSQPLWKYVLLRNDSGRGPSEVYGWQLEKGTIPSDYSLSQNDLQRLASENTASQIDQYDTGTVQPIKGIANDALGKANNANSKIDGLRIGGRNLLKNSRGRFQPSGSKLDNFTVYKDTTAYLENGKTYTISAKAKDGLVFSSVHDPTKQSNKVTLWMVDAVWKYNIVVSDDKTDTVGTVFKWGSPTGTYQLRVNTYNADNSGYAEFVQIQEGTRATEWQPSDLDLPDTIVSTVTTTTNAKQIVDSSGIYSEVTKLVDTKVGDVTTQLNSYKHTVDDTGKKLRDVMGTLKLDSNGNLTSNFNELIKTASGVEERYTQLSGKIDGLKVGGRNYLRESWVTNRNAPSATYDSNTKTWTVKLTADGGDAFGQGLRFTSAADRNLVIPYGQTAIISMEIKPEYNCQFGRDINNYPMSGSAWTGNDNDNRGESVVTPGYNLIGGQWNKVSYTVANTSPKNTNKVDIYDSQSNFGVMMKGQSKAQTVYIRYIMWELGTVAGNYYPALEDTDATIQAVTSRVTTAEGTITQVKKVADGTKSIVTQLSNLFGVNVGDSSISVTNNEVLVKGKQIHIDGQTVIDNGVIESAKIKSLDAGKITTGTLNAANVKVINLDANNIKSGTISGNNLSLNLDNGTVSFKKGKIVSSNNKLILNIDDGSLAVGDASQRQGMMFNQGKMYMYDQGYFGNSTWNGNVYDWMLEMKKHPYAVLEYSSSFSGTSGSIFGGSGANFHSTSGVAIAYDKNVSQTASAGTVSGIFDTWNPLDGHGVFINENGIAMGAEDKLVSIVGGTSFRYGQYSIWNYKPTILVGTNLWTDNVYDHGYNVNKMISDGPNIYMQASALITDTSAAIFNVENGDVEFAIKSNDRNVIINASGHTSNGLIVKGSQNITNWLGCQDLSVRGNKNSVVQTSQGWTKINAYETAEYYFGDLGTAVTDDTSTVRIGIEPLFNETVNTDIPYQVFVTSYGKGYAWVAERGSNYFVIKSSVPNLEIGYEIKAKRKGYENVRLEIDKHMEVNKR